MKILYDHQTFTGSLYGGVSRYFCDLMHSFSQRNDVSFELSLLFSNNEYLKDVPYIKPTPYSFLSNYLTVNQIASFANRAYSNHKIKQGHFDILHPTYYHPYFLKNSTNKPVVITFHDALSEKFGTVYPDLGQHLTQRKKQCLARADAVIAISEATKREILQYFDIDESKITVIPHGNPFSETAIAHYVPQLQLPERYVLYVGNRKLYKNFDLFIAAMLPILRKDNGLKIVCASSEKFDKAENELFQKYNITDKVEQIPIKNDGTLIELYKRARLFVYPSLMEGFGLPILEAMSCGCPIVASNGTSFNEIAEDAAVYFDATNSESMSYGIESVLFDEEKTTQMSRKGIEKAAHFTLQKTAEATLNLYLSLI